MTLRILLDDPRGPGPGPGPGIPNGDDSLRVPLFAGLLSAIGTLLLGLLCMLIWFAVSGDGGRIRLGAEGEPGEFDDESALLEEEQDALELMDEQSRDMYYEARAYQMAHPPNSLSTDISLSQFMTIQEKGVHAWEFEADYASSSCIIQARSELEFVDGISSVQTNLPLPKQNEVYYWEVKIYDKPADTKLSIGLTTKPYPLFRLPGYHKYSVAYDSEGKKRINQPFSSPNYGPPLQQGDVVGVGYKPRTGSVFFTRNGKKLEEALHGLRMNLFPTIGSTGPATVFVNLGQGAFVFIEGNVKKWGLASAHGSLAPPPPYGAERDYVLLETGQDGTSELNQHVQGHYSHTSGYRGGNNIPSSSSATPVAGSAYEAPPPSFAMATTPQPRSSASGSGRGRVGTINEVEESVTAISDHDNDHEVTVDLDTNSCGPDNISLERINTTSPNRARDTEQCTHASAPTPTSTPIQTRLTNHQSTNQPITGSPPPSYTLSTVGSVVEDGEGDEHNLQDTSTNADTATHDISPEH